MNDTHPRQRAAVLAMEHARKDDPEITNVTPWVIDAIEEAYELGAASTVPSPVDSLPVTRYHFDMILTEVIYETEAGIGSRRRQNLNKAETANFPIGRMIQAQNAAAMQCQQELSKSKKFESLEVLILSVIPLGWFTDEEFFGKSLPPTDESTPEVAVTATAGGDDVVTDNVVPFKPQ